MKRVHVAVGVIVNGDGQILLSRRAADSHQGGLWEFPGGKLEDSEDVQTALARELEEELGIRITRFEPLVVVSHDYHDKLVLLDTWVIQEFAGEPVSRESQPLAWVTVDQFENYPLPAANQPILDALRDWLDSVKSD